MASFASFCDVWCIPNPILEALRLNSDWSVTADRCSSALELLLGPFCDETVFLSLSATLWNSKVRSLNDVCAAFTGISQHSTFQNSIFTIPKSTETKLTKKQNHFFKKTTSLTIDFVIRQNKEFDSPLSCGELRRNVRSGSLWLRNRVIVRTDAVDHWIWIQISDDISGTESFSDSNDAVCRI